jgi:hypothetical protein
MFAMLKSHFSAAFSRTGRRRPYACYYIHLEPGSSYVGGGLWAPEPPTIQLLRESIDERPHVWRQVLSSDPFRGMFLPKAKGGVEGALTAFAEVNKEGALKTKPKVRVPLPKDSAPGFTRLGLCYRPSGYPAIEVTKLSRCEKSRRRNLYRRRWPGDDN